MSWLRRILAGPEPDEILLGDWVRRPGFKGVAMVEEVRNGLAIVTYRGARVIAIPVTHLRLVKRSNGCAWDVRR
jgi:hypothetical protein